MDGNNGRQIMEDKMWMVNYGS